MVAASAAEIVSIGLIVPFLGILTAPEAILRYEAIASIAEAWGIVSSTQIVGVVALAFCLAASVAAAIRLLLLYASTRFSYALGADLSLEVYRRTLYQPYLVHSSRNSSDIINGIVFKTASIIGNVISPILTILSSFVLIVGVTGALVAIDPVVSIVSITSIGVMYGIVLKYTRERMRADSDIVARESSNVVRSLQEGLGGIRDVLLDGTQEVYAKIYQQSDRPMRRAQGRIAMAVGSPRFLVETIGVILIAGLAVLISQREGGAVSAIPLLGALALGAQRLLPVAQQGYSSLATIRGTEASLADIIELLDQPMPDLASSKPVVFERELRLDDVGFSYADDRPMVVKGVSLSIAKGSRIGLFGPTGGGKSTLLDIVMGLLPATSGALLIDGETITASNLRGWQDHIAHVPQNIFLSDASVTENIAFGVAQELIDMDRVVWAAERAQIHDTIEAWPTQYRTSVGERGLRISGGQRQRIGLARALYKQADVIVLDEATSALDNETEKSVMEAVAGLDRRTTLFIVAHRLSTLRNCDLVAEIVDGRINAVGSFDKLIRPRLEREADATGS